MNDEKLIEQIHNTMNALISQGLNQLGQQNPEVTADILEQLQNHQLYFRFAIECYPLRIQSYILRHDEASEPVEFFTLSAGVDTH